MGMDISQIELLKLFPKYQKIIYDKLINGNNIVFANAATNMTKTVVAASFKANNNSFVVVYPNIYYANLAYLDYLDLLEADEVSFFPVEEIVSSELIASSSDFRIARLLTLKKIIENKKQLIVTTLEGYTRMVPSKDKMISSFLKIDLDSKITKKELENALYLRGYKKVSITDCEGTYSVRGSVVDCYIIGSTYPVRFSFDFDEIENIKYFDPTTQLSVEKTKEVTIYPVYELFYKETEYEEIAKRITLEYGDNEIVKQDLENLKNYKNLDTCYKYLPFIDPNATFILTLLSFPTVIFNELGQIIEKENQNIIEYATFLENTKNKSINKLFKSINEIIPYNSKTFYFTQFYPNKEEIKNIYHLNDINIEDVKTSNVIDYNNNFKNLTNELKINNNKTYIITHNTQEKLKFIEDVLNANDLKYNHMEDARSLKQNIINTMCSTDAIGFSDYEENFEIISPHELSKGKVTRHHKYQKLYNESKQIYSKEELKVGDYVVHRDYGIGIYKGIESITLGNTINDYIKIEYASESKLFIPVENIYVLEKYMGNSDKIPKLSKTNSKEWSNKKAKIKAKLLETAKKLIDIQAKREILQGFVYEKDTPLQKEFENDFEYVETPGQLKATEDVKKDMESTHPMDRLICGDVGFGKTEVAMRAAFKAVESGKQVLYLVPTTVLARQHYYSFKNRFEKYGVRVEMLSRFVDDVTTKKTLEGLKKGYVDIVVGTHRLLSNDVICHDLGLLIIDEEHRFGVEHKERIKEMKANVDVLSLSATPIPRTLQMALTGLRDMSLIETPPVNRLSVQTYVLKSNDSVIREAINRELGRGGQVFYLLNRISELDKICRKIHRLVPNAKIGLIHGKMSRDEIEDTITQFLERTYDVLVCTTIVETGIDIPNANTIIIEKANMLGLAQIYQIRGRVGRSDRIAYAYLMYDNESLLTETARKRLETIKEFTTLGSGYKIAMRDLSIRGAGDILGSEQSGFIDDIGIDLYMKMLEEAIAEQKGIVKKEEDKRILTSASRHIDLNYVDDDAIRIAMHQSISKVCSREDAVKLINEFTDKYGKTSPELELYIESRYLEYLLKSKGIETYKEKENEVEFNFDKEHTKNINYNKIVSLSLNLPKAWRFKYLHERIYINISLDDVSKEKNKNNYIYKIVSFLENI